METIALADSIITILFVGALGALFWRRLDRIELRLLHLERNMATKQDIADLRAELKADIADLRAELKADIAELRAELKADIADLRAEFKADIAELRAELKADIAELRTELAGTRSDLTHVALALGAQPRTRPSQA